MVIIGIGDCFCISA